MLRLLKPPSALRVDTTPSVPADPLRALGEQAIQGDLAAQRTLLVTLGPTLLRVIRGVLGIHHPDVEDVLQEAMVAVHQALPGFRGDSTTAHFACRVALRVAMNARRRSGYRTRLTPSTPPDLLEQQGQDPLTPGTELDAARRREALRELVMELPLAQAEVLALHTMLGHTVQEVASAMGLPVDTVRSRLRAALTKLRARVQSDRTLLEALEGTS